MIQKFRANHFFFSEAVRTPQKSNKFHWYKMQVQLFGDIFLNGHNNKENCRYWTYKNPWFFRVCHTLYKVFIRAGILGNTVVEYLFVEEIVTGELYLNLFEEMIDPLITSRMIYYHILDSNQSYEILCS